MLFASMQQCPTAPLELLGPGLVELDQWWPDGPPVDRSSLVEQLIIGAVGLKP
jgi:hypothetical protein